MILKKIKNRSHQNHQNHSSANANIEYSYQWMSKEDLAQSPQFDDLNDALRWIIKHDNLSD